MKRLFTFQALILIVSVCANAQMYRKTWDFRNGFSTATIAALQADMEQNGATGENSHWRDYYKDSTLTGGGQGAFWCSDNGAVGNDDGFVTTTVDGVSTVIPELEGLTLKGIKAKGLVIAYNFAQSANENAPNGMFPNGKSFLWFNGKGLTFNIKNVKKGEMLNMGIESHNINEWRGVWIYVDGKLLTPESGNNMPKCYENVIWNIPDDTPDVDDYVDVKVTSTNGCHIYYIIVGSGLENVVKIDGICYILDYDNKIAMVVNDNSSYFGNIIIPEKVKYGDNYYAVTSIGEKSFFNCRNLTSITIPSSVTSIDNYAFYGCDNLTEVFVNWKTPIKINNTIFSNTDNATLYVPYGSESAYASTFSWKDFRLIVPMKCEKPTITFFASGKIKVESATKGAKCITNITASNVEPLTDGEISLNTPLTVYTVKAYATAEGYSDSDEATATFRWEKTEGDMNGDGTVNIADVVQLVNMILGN